MTIDVVALVNAIISLQKDKQMKIIEQDLETLEKIKNYCKNKGG